MCQLVGFRSNKFCLLVVLNCFIPFFDINFYMVVKLQVHWTGKNNFQKCSSFSSAALTDHAKDASEALATAVAMATDVSMTTAVAKAT